MTITTEEEAALPRKIRKTANRGRKRKYGDLSSTSPTKRLKALEKKRKEARITEKSVKGLAVLQCTQQEAAGFFEITRARFGQLLQNSPRLRDAWEMGREGGKASLRILTWRHAQTNWAACKHLCEHWLGEKDHVVFENLDLNTLSPSQLDLLTEKLEEAVAVNEARAVFAAAGTDPPPAEVTRH